MAERCAVGKDVTRPRVVMGTPRAPKATGAVSKISVRVSASSGAKPRPMSRALPMATGVPKPAMPSINAPKLKPTTSTRIRRSGGTLYTIQRRNSSNLPVCTATLYNHIAFQTIHITGSKAKVAPRPMLRTASPTGMLHTVTATSRPTSSPARAACQAGKRTIPNRTSTTTMGINPTRNERKRLCPTGSISWWNMVVASSS